MRRALALLLVGVSLGVGCSRSATAPVPTASPPVTPSAVATASAAASPAPTYGTRKCWPIVLVHGSPGFSSIGPIDYFFEVPGALRAQGFEVFAPDFQGDTIAARGSALVASILARYPDPRVQVNLVAHSAGGLDARYAISTLGLGPKVASLTTIAAPHRGCSVNDLSRALFPNVPSWLDLLISLVGFDTTEEFTTSYVQGTFNPQNPDDPGVAYFSWCGATDLASVFPCFWLSWVILTATEGPNDGVVSVESAKWGTFLGTIPTDHLGEVGQLLGVTSGGFDQKTFYEDWASQLEARGFGP
jgi:triacylglycerol lipase